MPTAVREKNLGKSRIPSSGNDGSLYQPGVKMMGQIGKIFVDRIGLTQQPTKGKKGVEEGSSFILFVGFPMFEKRYDDVFSS